MEARAMVQLLDVGLVGLGLMGSAMGQRLLRAGHMVHGFDPVASARHAHEARGGTLADSPAEVAARCRVVLLSLPNGQVSRSACLDTDGVRDGARIHTVVVDTSTTLPEEAEGLAAELAGNGIGFFGAALSGSSDMVARGDALGMIGGPVGDALFTVEHVLDAFCREVMHVGGGHGDGMRAKLVVNEVLTLNRFALAEGLVFAESMGVDPELMLRVLRSSAASSTAMAMWGQRMVDRNYTEPVSRIRQHNKDAQLILSTGHRHGAPMFAMSLVNQFVQIGLANGLSDADNSSIVEVLRSLAGIAPGLSHFGGAGTTPAGPAVVERPEA